LQIFNNNSYCYNKIVFNKIFNNKNNNFKIRFKINYKKMID